MRIHYQDLRNPRRAPLREGVPLDTPFLVMIDPANICNLKCSYCPTGHRDLTKLRNNGIMDWDLYVKIVDGFKVMPHRIKQLTFCKDGEPLLNKHLVDMIKLAKEAEIADRIWLRTNGLLLNPKLNYELSNSGLDLIGISIKALSDEGYEKATGVKADYKYLRDMVYDLYSECEWKRPIIYVNTVNNGLSKEDVDKFFRDFEGISDSIAIEDMHGWSAGFLKDGTTAVDTVVTTKIACPWPLFTMGINYNGQVSACQEDWSMRNLIGDLNTQTVREVWRGEKRREFIFMHLDGWRWQLDACEKCSYIEYCPDNIDDYRTELAERL